MRCLRQSLQSSVGTSLLETMIAMVVIVVGLSGVQRIFPQSVTTSIQAVERTQATLLGKGQLEQLRIRGFPALQDIRAQTVLEPFRNSQQEVIFEPFRWQMEVLPLADDLLEVRLRVVWPWQTAKQQLQFATYVSQR